MKSIIIPARLESVRFPNKPLHEFRSGKTLLQLAWECAQKRGMEVGAETYIATSNEELADAAHLWGAKVLLTEECNNGSERVYKAAESLHLTGTIINWQADLPYLPENSLQKLIEQLRDRNDIGTLHYLSDEDSPNLVKLVLGKMNNVLYCSRSNIPYGQKIRKVHCGVYAYDMNTLKKLVNLPITNHLKLENLEQLAWLIHNFKVYSTLVKEKVWNIDTLEQAQEFEGVSI